MTDPATPDGSRRVTGSFEAKMTPQPPYDTSDGINLGRATVAKTFHGPLEATGSVEMLGAMTPVQGSAGYVAIERVVGTLEGRAGSFVLQHSAAMNRGQPQMAISVVPDSGTGDLKGLSGTMRIDIVESKHFYTLDYRLDGTP